MEEVRILKILLKSTFTFITLESKLGHRTNDLTSLTSLPTKVRVFSECFPHQPLPLMPPATPPLDFTHQPGDEIPTKHKEAIRQLYGFAKIPVEQLITRYRLVRSIVEKILQYDIPERLRITRTGRPSLLTNIQTDKIIEYLSESWEYRILNFGLLRNELHLECTVKTLERRLK